MDSPARRPDPARRPEGPDRRLIAVMAAVLTLAMVIFVDGFLSLLLDRDQIEEPDAGPLVGPSMVASVCAVVFVFVLRARRRLGARAAAAGLASVVGGPAGGAVLYAVVRGELGVIPVFFGTHILSPFVWAAGGVAALVVAASGLILAGDGTGSGRA